MTKEELFRKNAILGSEFDRYLLEHPDFADRIPESALVVLLPEDNPELCKENLKIAKKSGKIDDVKDRPIVYVKIEKLAPPRSRIVNPRLEMATK